MTSQDPIKQLNQAIASGKGDQAFVPKITLEKDPSGTERELWCWHLPRDAKEYHGVAKMTPYSQTLGQYIAALQFRFKLHFELKQVQGYRPPDRPTPRFSDPLPPHDPQVKAPVTLLTTPPPPVKSLGPQVSTTPPILAISEVIPLAEKLPTGSKMLLTVAPGLGPEYFRNNLRTALNTKPATKAFTWSITTVYPKDIDFPEGAQYKRLVRVEKSGLRQVKVTAVERHVEEKIERTTTERSVTVQPTEEEPTPTDFLAIRRMESVAPPLQAPGSYLPPDGPEAKRVLDLHAELAGLEVGTEEFSRCLYELWGICDGIKQYRDAKATTDRILKPWLEANFADFTNDPTMKDVWWELWMVVHGTILDQIKRADEIKAKEPLTDTERAFHNLALKFFANEEELSESDWKRINDKELPAMAKKILGLPQN